MDEEAKVHLIMAANGLSAFSGIQAYFVSRWPWKAKEIRDRLGYLHRSIISSCMTSYR